MKRNEQQPANDTATSSVGNHTELLGEWVAHLRPRRVPLREECLDRNG